MTQQFKFGDMVKSRMHPNKTLGLVVDAGSNQYSYIIRWEHTKGVSQEHTESLELILHPDTVRLDWMIENQAYVVHELPDEDCAYFSVSLDAGGQIAANSTARQAIDTAMREKAA